MRSTRTDDATRKPTDALAHTLQADGQSRRGGYLVFAGLTDEVVDETGTEVIPGDRRARPSAVKVRPRPDDEGAVNEMRCA